MRRGFSIGRACCLMGFASVSACVATPAEPDTTAPVVTVSMLDPYTYLSGASDSSLTPQRGCPSGAYVTRDVLNAFVRDSYGERAASEIRAADSYYFYSDESPPFQFLISATDNTAVTRIAVSFDETIVAETLERPPVLISGMRPDAIETRIRHSTSDPNMQALVVERDVSQARRPNSSLLMSFTASSLGAQPRVLITSEDVNGNRARFSLGFAPRSLCER